MIARARSISRVASVQTRRYLERGVRDQRRRWRRDFVLEDGAYRFNPIGRRTSLRGRYGTLLARTRLPGFGDPSPPPPPPPPPPTGSSWRTRFLRPLGDQQPWPNGLIRYWGRFDGVSSYSIQQVINLRPALQMGVWPDPWYYYHNRSSAEIAAYKATGRVALAYIDPFMTHAYHPAYSLVFNSGWGLWVNAFWRPGYFNDVVKPMLDAFIAHGQFDGYWIDDLGWSWAGYGRANTQQEARDTIALIQQMRNYLVANGFPNPCLIGNTPGSIIQAAYGLQGMNGPAPTIANPATVIPLGQADLIGLEAALDACNIEGFYWNHGTPSSQGRQDYEIPAHRAARQIRGMAVIHIDYVDDQTEIIRIQTAARTWGWPSCVNPVGAAPIAYGPLIN